MTASDLRIGLVGLGKIARDEHLPAISHTAGMQLVAVASRNATAAWVPSYPDLATMLDAGPQIDAVVLCQPPAARFEAAMMAISAGKHVFLEKPPGATLGEVALLEDAARAAGVTLFASWHSRWSAPVAALEAWCDGRELKRIAIAWKEDVRLWHPGQDWIWEAGGFGVLDPGINALSILTRVVPQQFRVTRATFAFPANKHAPIAASMALRGQGDLTVDVAFDWRQTGPQIWRIDFHASDGAHFLFEQGGETSAALPDGEESALTAEYRAMYRHFGELVRVGASDVDVQPLRLVADAFMCGEIERVAAFVV